MKPEGFRAILAYQGQEGALLYLADKVEELSARVAALDTRPQSLTKSEEQPPQNAPSPSEGQGQTPEQPPAQQEGL